MDKIKRIVVAGVSKKFITGHKNNLGVLARLLLLSNREPKSLVYVLKDVSFDVFSGEILGVVGDNGSGKSTLLRTIAGVYSPDEGRVVVEGKVIALINLVIGLKDRLSMKENIFLCCSLFGLSQNEIKEKLHNIVDFSGLQNFFNTKIYQFSEGMKQRLAFSIAIHCNPDILLLDEVFEVGDEDFKKKSGKSIVDIADRGGCVVIVSHETEIIKKYCNRVLQIDRGIITMNSRPGRIKL